MFGSGLTLFGRAMAALWGAVFLLFLTVAAALGAEPVRITHTPIELNRASLVVVGPKGETEFSPADLEALGFRRMTTVTPWRETPAAFDGVLLQRLLAAQGMMDASAIEVISENEDRVVIPSSLWRRYPVLLATRVNGLAHTRRARGPIQLILPQSKSAALGGEDNLKYWAWMVARIEAVF